MAIDEYFSWNHLVLNLFCSLIIISKEANKNPNKIDLLSIFKNNQANPICQNQINS